MQLFQETGNIQVWKSTEQRLAFSWRCHGNTVNERHWSLVFQLYLLSWKLYSVEKAKRGEEKHHYRGLLGICTQHDQATAFYWPLSVTQRPHIWSNPVQTQAVTHGQTFTLDQLLPWPGHSFVNGANGASPLLIWSKTTSVKKSKCCSSIWCRFVRKKRFKAVTLFWFLRTRDILTHLWHSQCNVMIFKPLI